MKTETTKAVRIHPFEQSGLGLAPFQFVGMTERSGPIRTEVAPGIFAEVGSPGQPMGTCDHCGTGIKYCCEIVSRDGKRSIVGLDCVAKTYKECATTDDARMAARVRAEKNAIARTAARARREKREAPEREYIARMLAVAKTPAVAARLAAAPHPRGFDDLTAADYVEWMEKHAGHAGCLTVAKFVESFTCERGDVDYSRHNQIKYDHACGYGD